MCKYLSVCSLCNHEIQVNAAHENMKDVSLEISSECPNIQALVNHPISLDAIYEIVVSKEKSELYSLISQHHAHNGCSLYDNVKDAIGKNLGRYYELV